MFRTRTLVAALALAAALPGLAAAEEGDWAKPDFTTVNAPTPIPGAPLDEAEIRAGLTALGYEQLGEIEGSAPYYMITATYDGQYMPLSVDSETGEVSPIALPDKQTIETTTTTTITTLTDTLTNLGYSRVEVVEETDEQVTTRAWRYGEPVTVTVDRKTGQVTNLDQDATQYVVVSSTASPDDVRAGLESIGYVDVADVHLDGDVYRGRGTWLGEPVDLWVDARTGEVRAWTTAN
jgi:hypothetical protein